MRKWFQRTDEPFWLYMLAGALLIGGPVWNYLYVNGYPFSRPEAFVLPLLGGLLGAGCATAAYALGANLGSVVFGALLLVFLDLQFDIAAWPFPVIVPALICLLASLLLRARRALIACIVLATFNLASLPRFGRPKTATRADAVIPTKSNAPLLVHIVLDEQWGIGGLRAAGDTALANYLTDFYLKRGFEVHEAAYSRWRRTWQSLSRMMALGAEPKLEQLGLSKFRLIENPYFAWLESHGYQIQVSQLDFLDYCRSSTPVATCSVATSVSIANFGQLNAPWTQRGFLAGRFFLNVASYFYARMHRDPLVWRRSFTGRGLRQLNEMRTSIKESPAGSAFFTHVLEPHRPLEVDADCRVAQRLYDFSRGNLSRKQWGIRLKLYGNQVRCLHRALTEIIAEVDRVAGRDRSIILIHGDHGSRILEPEDKLDELNAEQLNALFSTLLVLRRPHVAPALYADPVPLQDFFWELVQQNWEGAVRGPWSHYVMHQRVGRTSVDTVYLNGSRPLLWARQTTNAVDLSGGELRGVR